MSELRNKMIQQMQLKGYSNNFCKIRYYGIFASRNRKEVLLQCKKIVAYIPTKSKLTGLSWQDALKAITGMDASKCPICKTGNMITTALLNGYRAPPFFKN